MKKFNVLAIIAAAILALAVVIGAYNLGYSKAVNSVEAAEVTENGYNVTFNGEVYCYE